MFILLFSSSASFFLFCFRFCPTEIKVVYEQVPPHLGIIQLKIIMGTNCNAVNILQPTFAICKGESYEFKFQDI